MSNDERNSGGSGDGANGGGGGRGRDFVDDGAEAGDPTVVIVSDTYTRGLIGRLGDGLRGAAALCDGFREGGKAASTAERIAKLGELKERLKEMELHAAGAVRGVGRLEREAIAKLSAALTTKEGTT